MLFRLVRMRFQPDQVETFLHLYAAAASTIASQPGCLSVQLVRQMDDPASFATWSVWESVEALDRYRASPFFVQFWPQVKALFRAPPEVVSFKGVQ